MSECVGCGTEACPCNGRTEALLKSRDEAFELLKELHDAPTMLPVELGRKLDAWMIENGGEDD